MSLLLLAFGLSLAIIWNQKLACHSVYTSTSSLYLSNQPQFNDNYAIVAVVDSDGSNKLTLPPVTWIRLFFLSFPSHSPFSSFVSFLQPHFLVPTFRVLNALTSWYRGGYTLKATS
jgi:hypothetical protein